MWAIQSRSALAQLVRNFACWLLYLIASRAASLVPTIAPGFHDDVRTISATKSSMSLTTRSYCLGDLILPDPVTPPGPRDHFMLTPTPVEPRIRPGYRMSSCLSSLLIVVS